MGKCWGKASLARPACVSASMRRATPIMSATRQALAEAGLGEDALQITLMPASAWRAPASSARAKHLRSWLHPFAGAWFEGDGYLAWLGAFGGGEGGIVVCGTGSIGITYQGPHHPRRRLWLSRVRRRQRRRPRPQRPALCPAHARRPRRIRRSVESDPRAVLEQPRRGDPLGRNRQRNGLRNPGEAGDATRSLRRSGSAPPLAGSRQRTSPNLLTALFNKGVPKVALVGGLAETLKAYMPPNTAARLVAPQADAMAGGILLAKRKIRRRLARPPTPLHVPDVHQRVAPHDMDSNRTGSP